jgi:hypothetical protein
MMRVALTLTLALALFGQTAVRVTQSKPATVTHETKVVNGQNVHITHIVMEIQAQEADPPVPAASEWCAQGNPSDCLVLTSGGGEVVTGYFVEGGRKYADAMGYGRGDKISLAFRRLNNSDIGFVTLILRDAKTADGRTFNADGTQRWRGVYAMKTR